ncbi:MAG: hypothetical protein JWP06_646 [Candidatus Saccharibacteria bacterium]|nr:hypothetical protein [Candidatus Saccharibacteria bacterium]
MDISPKDFLRQRRPKKFSDSKKVEKPAISSPILESHLLTLTKRNEHDLFEEFARRLCEVEISPNIKPNTGPAGGGDGKTDAESYPVSSDTAMGWYVGYETAGKDEKLAFAISAKEAWQSKLKSDLKKINDTGTKFTRVYFVTNQHVEASLRKKLEKVLSKQYSTDVHILDLTWIIDKVYTNNRIELAIKALNIEIDTPQIIENGPIDMVRQRKIIELDKAIENAISSAKANYATVRDAIDSAVYSREQELPRTEVEGKLDRAIRLADKYGTANQRFMARYQKCWTAFWYFEDFQAVKDWYNEAQKYALKAGEIDNLEKLANLRQNLSTVRRKDKKIVSKAFIDSKTKALLTELELIAQNKNSPSASLFARAIIEETKMTDNLTSGSSIDDNLRNLEEIMVSSEGYAGFPFKSLAEIIAMLGDVVGNNKQYDSLFNKITEITQKREGEKQSAKMILDRAKTLLNQDQYYKAIQVLGSALSDLHKEETLEEAAEALYLMGSAYEQGGLTWAARGSYLNVASFETARFFREDEVSYMQLGAYNAMIEIERKLGRLPQVMQWYEVFNAFFGILPEDEWDKEKLSEELLMSDLKIGSVLLAMPSVNDNLTKLIDPLKKLGLDNSVLAVQYRIGRDDLWPTEFTDNVPVAERDKFFNAWAHQTTPSRAPYGVDYYDQKEITLLSSVLGCQITVHCMPNDLLIMTGESVLASAESFMSTTLLYRGTGTEPSLDIYIKSDPTLKGTKLIYNVDSDEAKITISVPDFNPHKIAVEDQNELVDSIKEIAIHVTAFIVAFEDTEESFKQILGTEKAFVRSVNFTLSYIRLGNVIGHHPKYRLDDWLPESKKSITMGTNPISPLGLGKDKPIDYNHFDKEQISHKQLKAVSIIRQSLWDNAGWRGMMFAFAPSLDLPPVLALIFDNSTIGEKIFQQWNEQFGHIDKDEMIRVAIMRNIDLQYPCDYRVGVSANIKRIISKDTIVTSSTRIHTMTPDNTTNLDGFLERYKKKGKYLFTVATFNSEGQPIIREDLGIVKKELIIKIPKDIKKNDMDEVLLGNSRTNV